MAKGPAYELYGCVAIKLSKCSFTLEGAEKRVTMSGISSSKQTESTNLTRFQADALYKYGLAGKSTTPFSCAWSSYPFAPKDTEPVFTA